MKKFMKRMIKTAFDLKKKKQQVNEVLEKIESNRAFRLSTYDFSTIYITLRHYMIKENLTGQIE